MRLDENEAPLDTAARHAAGGGKALAAGAGAQA